MLEDLPILMTDFGKPVSVGGVTLTGMKDERPARLFQDQAELNAVQRTVLVLTSALPALTDGMAVTYDGTGYVLAAWEPDAETLDGAYTRLYLEDA